MRLGALGDLAVKYSGSDQAVGLEAEGCGVADDQVVQEADSHGRRRGFGGLGQLTVVGGGGGITAGDVERDCLIGPHKLAASFHIASRLFIRFSDKLLFTIALAERSRGRSLARVGTAIFSQPCLYLGTGRHNELAPGALSSS